MASLDSNVPTSCRRPLWVGVLLCALGLAAPSAPSAAPADDLAISFSSEKVAGEAGNIVGAVTNRSGLLYPCVDAVFSLSTHFDDRQKGRPVVSYGTQTIRIQDIAPGATARFSAPLLRKAGFGFLRYETCGEPGADGAPPPAPPAPPAPPPPPPAPPAPPPPPPPAPPAPPPAKAQVCEVTGSIASETGFEGLDDRGQREVIERVYVLDAADRKLVAEVRLGKAETRATDHRTGRSYSKRSYRIAGLSANRRYIVRLSHAWRTKPPEFAFSCPDARKQHRLQLPMLRHTGNRLGG